MPLPVISGVVRVTLNWTNANIPDPAANVMHFSTSMASAGAMYAAFDGVLAANPDWNAPVSNQSKVTSIDFLPLDGSSPTSSFVTGIDSYYSGQSASAGVPQAAATITWKTGFRGRSKRGRTFLPHIGEAAMDSGALLGSELADLQAAWTAALPDFVAADLVPVVASYTLEEAEAVTAFVARQRISTQRRRQSYG